ncbi:hypothetical protein [Saccharopolyspora shandongensis]|uniref:hypothetical protein n=1 Tax=Saccharopolyspora shandongensis TaxID=418495 RepID=UPI00340CA705
MAFVLGPAGCRAARPLLVLQRWQRRRRPGKAARAQRVRMDFSGLVRWALGHKVSSRASRTASCPARAWLMADGSSKPIEEIREGEEVLATDPVTGETTSRRVVATITGEGQKALVEITVDTDGQAGDETGVLVATDGHPF